MLARPPPNAGDDENDAGKVAPLNSTPAKRSDSAKKPDFEYSLARLEEIVKKLESANLSLEDAMKLFEEGVQLSRDCQKYLEQAEGKVEILLKKAGGELAAEPFDPEAEETS
jgi:exodeoxyribonuclease VII small subunit